MLSEKSYILILLGASAAIYLLLLPGIAHPIVMFTLVAILNSIIFLWIVSIIKDGEFALKYIILFAAAGIIFRLTVLPVYPAASDDIYRYIWDGKMQANGINPYRFAPDDPALNKFHSDMLPVRINHAYMKSIYPPYSQYVFLLSYTLFGESIYGIKILLFISEMLSILLLFLVLRQLKLPEKNLLYYALCPLPIMQFMIDGHIDGTGFPILLLVILLFAMNRQLPGYLMLGISISSKFITGMILPFLFQESRNWKKLLILMPFLVIGITYIPYYEKGINLFEALFEFTENWYANSSVFMVVFGVVNDNQDARKISAILFLISGLILFFLKLDWHKKIYLIFFLFLIFSPTVHPWYVTWLAVLLPVYFRWSGAVFVSSVSLANIPIIDYVIKGVWSTSYTVLLAEYIPVFTIVLFELHNYLSKKRTGLIFPTEKL